ncbi:MAG: hypothetical protein NTV60_01050 [Candidatus Kaiserbacteria bacterium]|nr:hypothetical protein [Candidatus Kaiserbacteria bacterium]
MNLFPIIPLFIFSLITYKMRDDVYRVWIRFSCAWIPLSMILIFVSPEYSGGFGIPLYSMTKGSVAFMSSLLFVLISLLIVVWKYVASLPKY